MKEKVQEQKVLLMRLLMLYDVQHQYSPHTYQQAPSVLDTDLGQWSGTPHVLFIWLTYNVSGFVNIKRHIRCPLQYRTEFVGTEGVQEPIRAQ